MKKQVAELSKTRAKVGYLQDREQLLIAIFNEYGAKIPVTDKVRGLFIALGMPLKKTKNLSSFLNAPFCVLAMKK
ncbi:hypothetical protein ACLMAB_14365 [Brevibacillus laterosporus]